MNGTMSAADVGSVDRYVAAEVKRLNIPGLALTIVEGDRAIHTSCFGKADSTGRDVTPQTPFYIASLSKSFTAVAVMQLVESGKINLDDRVKDHLPWFELADKDAAASITVRQLLNQTSGISEFEGNWYWNDLRSLEDVIRGMGGVPLAHPVGEEFEYSNINYSIAGLIVEKASGEKLGDYIRRHIFEPLGMRHSYTSREPALADGVAEGNYYVLGHAFTRTRSQPPVYLPSSFIISSIEDMSHYLVANMNEGTHNGTSIVSPAGLKTLHTGVGRVRKLPLHYGMGWAAGSFEDEPMIRHNGELGNYHSTAFMLPSSRLGLVVLANASGFEQLSQVDEIGSNVLRLLKGKSPTPVSLPFGMRALYWTILLLPWLLAGGAVYGLMRWYGGLSLAGWQAWAVVPVYLAVAWFSLFKLPGLIPFPLSSMRMWYPELAYALVANGILGIGWSVASVALMMLQRK